MSSSAATPTVPSFQFPAVFDELFYLTTAGITRGQWVSIDTTTAVPAANLERTHRQVVLAPAAIPGVEVQGVSLETTTATGWIKVRRRGLVATEYTSTSTDAGAQDPGFDAAVDSAVAIDSPLQIGATAGRAALGVVGTDHVIGVSREVAAANVAAVEVRCV